MTISQSPLAANYSVTAGTSFSATLSGTPSGTVLVFYLARRINAAAPTQPTLSGGKATWTLVSDAYYDASGVTSHAWLFIGTGASDAGPIVFNHGATTHDGAGWVINDFTGDAGTVQVKSGQVVNTGTTDDSVTTRQVTFPSAPTGTCVVGTSKGSAAGASSVDAGNYSTIGQVINAATNFASGHELWWDLAGAEQQVDVVWPGPNKGCVIAVELEETSSAIPIDPNDLSVNSIISQPTVSIADLNYVGYAEAVISAGAWTPVGAADIPSAINEPDTPSDTEYARSEDNPTSSPCTVRVESLDDPNSDSGHTYVIRAYKDGPGTATLNVEWRSGYVSEGSPGTLIQSETPVNLTTTPTNYQFTLDAANAANIPSAEYGTGVFIRWSATVT